MELNQKSTLLLNSYVIPLVFHVYAPIFIGAFFLPINCEPYTRNSEFQVPPSPKSNFSSVVARSSPNFRRCKFKNVTLLEITW